MDNNYSIVNGANPSILWTQYMDFLSSYAKQMKSIYTKHIRQNQPISWSELDEVNDFVHKQLDYIITWSEKFKPEINKDEIYETNFTKQRIRLTESQLNRVIRRCINEALRNEMNEGWVKDEKKSTEEIFQDIINKFDENSIMRHIQYKDSTTPYEFFSNYIRDYYDVTLKQCEETLDKLEEYYDLPYFDYSQKEEYLKNNRG